MGALSVLGALEKWRGGTATPFRLSVAAGLHAGATTELTDSRYVIGSDIDADIILMDHGVEAQHVLIRRAGKQVDVEAIGGDVQVGRRQVRKGRGFRSSMPVGLAVGDARILIEAQSEPMRRAPFKRFAPIAATALCLCVAVTALAMNAPLANRVEAIDAETSPGQGFQTAAVGGGASGLAGFLRGQDNRPEVSLAAETLAAQLREVGLDGIPLDVEKNRIIASGSIAKEDSETWANAQAWFDQTFGDRIVLTSNVDVRGSDAPPRLSLQAVWYGPQPYILASDGARYHEGAYIEDGWAIRKIGENALLLSKDGATIALKYQ